MLTILSYIVLPIRIQFTVFTKKIQMKLYHYGGATLKSFYHCHSTDKPLTTV